MYGTKYLTFFHSQAMGPHPSHWLKTYYFGAYLFDAEPPFAISHSTPNPIIPHELYDEHTSGWAFKAIDYILFPTGLLIRGDVLYVTMGRNDNSGYILSLNRTGFMESLRPWGKNVLKNDFIEKVVDVEPVKAAPAAPAPGAEEEGAVAAEPDADAGVAKNSAARRASQVNSVDAAAEATSDSSSYSSYLRGTLWSARRGLVDRLSQMLLARE
jgi:hypothetical protein